MKRDDLIPDIQAKLKEAPYHCKLKGKHLEQGVCPQCNKKSLWTWNEQPWNVQCNKKNSCGYTERVEKLFPEIFTELSKRYIPTDENPNATADAYLKYIRGLDHNLLRGQYQQSVIFNSDNRNITAPSIRIFLDTEKTRYFERVIEDEKAVGKKAHFGGKRKADGSLFKGDVWQPQTQNLQAGDRIHIVEGIFDAIALCQAGYKAISCLSAGMFPYEFIKANDDFTNSKRYEWVWALDNDKAGINAAIKHMKTMSETFGIDSSCILPEKGSDWNDLLNAGKLTKHKDSNGRSTKPTPDAESYRRYKFYGDCATAETAEEKAMIIYAYRGRSFFTFDFAKRMYGFELDMTAFNDKMSDLETAYKKDNGLEEQDKIPRDEVEKLRNLALKQSTSVMEIANCVPEFLYTQRNPAADELAYFYRVSMPNGKVYKDTFSNAQQQTANKFNERLGSFAAGAMFDGGANFYSNLRKSWMYDVQEIRAIDFAGYDATSGGYVFPEFGVFNGEVHKLNNEEFIDTGKVQIKSSYHNVDIKCNTDLNDYSDEWFHKVHEAWGMNGLIAACYFTGAVFANQIRDRLQNFPFLELVGDPGTGKSALLKGLWEAFGRRGHEGTNPGGRKGTAKFLPRVLAQTTLPTVFVEGDSGSDNEKTKSSGVNWDDFKDLYGGIGLYGKANMSNDNQIKISDFRGSLVIAQNYPVKDAQPAFLQRIVQCWFDSRNKSEDTRKAAEALYQLDSDNMSGYLIKVIQKEKQFLEVFFKVQKEAEQRLLQDPNIKIQRIAFTHSVIMGLIKASCMLLPIKKETADQALLHVRNMAQDRQVFINSEDPRVEAYFDAIDFMSNMRHNPTSFNHSKNDDLLAIDLAHVESEARRHGVNVLPVVEIKPLLERSQAFVKKNHPVASAILGKTKKCWVFKARPKLTSDDAMELDGLLEGSV